MPKKTSFAEIIEKTNTLGFKFLSDEYTGQDSIYTFQCPSNHCFETSWKIFIRPHKYRCQQCAVNARKIDVRSIHNLIKKREYLLLEDFDYGNKDTPIQVQCSKGHRFQTSYHKLCKYTCNECSGHLKKTKEQIQEKFKDLILLDDYTNAHDILNWQCVKCKHIFQTKYSKLHLAKTTCPACRKKKISPRRKKFNEILRDIESEGYVFIAGKYKNNRSKLTVICPEKHRTKISWITWKQGSRCKICNRKKQGKIKYTEKFIRSFLEENGLELLDRKKDKITIKCHEGHITTRKWFQTYKYKRFCSKCKINRPEREIIKFLKDIGVKEIMHRARGIIGKKELDIYLPEYQLAIEYNGLFWHSDMIIKDNHYHIKKQNLCNKKGIQLLTIWQSEWEQKNEIVKNLIQGSLNQLTGLTNLKVTENLSLKDIQTFMTCNHIDYRNLNFTHSFALSDNEQIYSLLLYKKTSSDIVEIVDFCTRIANADSFLQLLSLIETTGVRKISFVVDRRFFNEKILVGNGFKRVSLTLGYRWTDMQHIYAKLPQEKEVKKLHKIYDNGQAKYIKIINQVSSSEKVFD